MATATAEKKEKVKIEKTLYGERDAEGELVNKLTWTRGQALPDGYSPGKHHPLKSKDFVSAADYYEFMADSYEKKMVRARNTAAEERSGLGKQTRAIKKKLLKLREQQEKLRQDLIAEGIDPDAILGGAAA